MDNQDPIKTSLEKVLIPGVYQPSPANTYETINRYFEDQNERDRTLMEAREILGDTAKDLSDQQVLDLANEVQFLADSWLEEYEKDIFGGKTLDELIKI